MPFGSSAGKVLARTLLAANQPVRAVVRDADKGAVWAAQGCEVALAEMHDEVALTAAFEGAEAAFVLPPPNFDPAPGFPEARAFAFLRPAWFMENSSWDVAPARNNGVIPSFLQPLDKPVPMVATIDIGHMAARLIRETWTGHRIV